MLLEPAGKSGIKGPGFDVVRNGDARVAMIGFPSGNAISQLNFILYLSLFNYIHLK